MMDAPAVTLFNTVTASFTTGVKKAIDKRWSDLVE
jgi:hypothetical protein